MAGRETLVRPETRYARSGEVNIAWQAVGDAPVDLLFVPGWVSHVEYAWEEPAISPFLERLTRFSRLILMDRRGTGLSDPVERLPTLEERMDDVRAVMNAAGSKQAFLFGVSEGGPMCCLFAATWPERSAGLVLCNTFATNLRCDDHPWAVPESEWSDLEDLVSETWGTGVTSRLFAPSRADDPAFVRSWARFERFAVSPGGMRKIIAMARDTDVRHVLPSIRVPTLVIHREGDRVTRIEGGRYLARHITGARLVEVPGNDHFPFLGNTDLLLAEIEHFVTGERSATQPDRVLATVLFADIADSTRLLAELGDRAWRDLLARFYGLIRHNLGRHRGREIDTTGDGLFASFDGPGRAVRCGLAIRDAVAPLGLAVRVGVHTGECEVLGDKVSGIAVHTGARVCAAAAAGEVLVTSTVKDLVAGSGLVFVDRGSHALRGIPDRWQLYVAEG